MLPVHGHIGELANAIVHLLIGLVGPGELQGG